MEDLGGEMDVDAGQEIEELIRRFRQLTISVPFRSDVDGRSEDHSVSLESGDTIVRSSPKPLKHVLTIGSWENFPLAAPIIVQLTNLRKDAKLALYKIGGNAKRNLTGARTAHNMARLRKKLEAIAQVLAGIGGPAHAATLVLPATDLSRSDNYGSTSSGTEGTHVIARPLSINSASPGSKPTDGRLMKAIRNLAGDKSKAYKQMHLLNDLVSARVPSGT